MCKSNPNPKKRWNELFVGGAKLGGSYLLSPPTGLHFLFWFPGNFSIMRPPSQIPRCLRDAYRRARHRRRDLLKLRENQKKTAKFISDMMLIKTKPITNPRRLERLRCAERRCENARDSINDSIRRVQVMLEEVNRYIATCEKQMKEKRNEILV